MSSPRSSHTVDDDTSADPCDENYGGVGPASDPETRLIQDELVRLGTAIKAMLSAHAGGQAWVHPYGHTESGVCARAPNHDALVSDWFVYVIYYNHAFDPECHDRGECHFMSVCVSVSSMYLQYINKSSPRDCKVSQAAYIPCI